VSQLNYHHLQYFRAVAHEGNLTRAAARLRVAQSAVSLQIRKLEHELGHPLFERRGRRLVLTEAGRIALDHADAIAAAGEELVSTLRERGRGRLVLRAGALATMSRNFQLRFFRPLLGRADAELVIRTGGLADLLGALEAHHLDVVLANAVPPRDAGTACVAHPIATQRVSLVGRLGRGRPRPLADLLAQEPLVLPTVGTVIRADFDALVDRLGVRPRIAAEVDDMAMLRLLARERVGLAVVPAIVVRDELDTGALAEVAPIPGLRETYYALTLTRRFPNPLIRPLLVEARAAFDAETAAAGPCISPHRAPSCRAPSRG
jgi:LysR family transcriptional activator of nhaA